MSIALVWGLAALVTGYLLAAFATAELRRVGITAATLRPAHFAEHPAVLRRLVAGGLLELAAVAWLACLVVAAVAGQS